MGSCGQMDLLQLLSALDRRTWSRDVDISALRVESDPDPFDEEFGL